MTITTSMGEHAYHTFDQIESEGPASRPLDFPPPTVRRGTRGNALVVDPETGHRDIWPNVVHRHDFRANPTHHTKSSGSSSSSHSTSSTPTPVISPHEYIAYFPQRRLQQAIYGEIWACLILRRHYGIAADDAARAAGLSPGDPIAPIVWEIVRDGNTHVAMKKVEWAKVHQARGRLLEDPVKEIAAMQYIGNTNPYVLGSSEVLQDDEFIYSFMTYARGGDLFGVVVHETEQRGGEGGMSESSARYWFRQILSGLHHLQSKGICHRDLSLENILVDGERCLIIDFGLCLRVPYTDKRNPTTISDVSHGVMRRLIKPQGTCGKHQYMAPEIFQNSENFDGFAIDLWAAGVILYIMLTGFPPYDHASLADQRFQIIAEGHLVKQLENWDIFLSEEAGDLLQRMLQVRPRDRLTLVQVLNHRWVTKSELESPMTELQYFH